MSNNTLITLLVTSVLLGAFALTGFGFIYLENQNLNSELQDVTDDTEQFLLQYEELNKSYNALLGVSTTLLEENTNLSHYLDMAMDKNNELMMNLNDTIARCANLNQTYNDLILEYEELNATYYILTGEYLELNDTYFNLIDEHDLLNQTHYDLLDEYEVLKSSNDQLTILLGDLTQEYQTLQDDYDELLINYNSLQTDYTTLFDNHTALQQNYQTLQQDYDDLMVSFIQLSLNYDQLSNSYNTLNDSYWQLDNDYNMLNNTYWSLNSSYDDLWNDYQLLNDSYTIITTWIRQQILPVQYCLFAEAVRRYYMHQYLEGKSGKEFYMAATEFARDIILHDSFQINPFSIVSNTLSDALIFGNDTMELCWQTMWNVFYPWLPNWGGYDLTGSELTDIDTVHQWCVDTIDYEYDSSITWYQEPGVWDYFKFPVETVFRTMGDCEDQAMFAAAYLESCGFETAIAIIHDPDHPVYGPFYHGVPLVHIEDTTAFWTVFPDCSLWRLGSIDPYYDEGHTWCWLDPTWNVPFGSEPAWLEAYMGGMSSDICSIAICDVDGNIGQIGSFVVTGT